MTWKSCEITRLKHIFRNDTLPTKQDLQNLTCTHLQCLHYFQIRSRLAQKEVIGDLQSKRKKTQFEQLIALEDSSTKHKLLMIYQILLDFGTKISLANVIAWECNCRATFSDLMREQLHTTQMTKTSILPIKIQAIKLLHRWYITPTQLYKARLLSNDFCWK